MTRVEDTARAVVTPSDSGLGELSITLGDGRRLRRRLFALPATLGRDPSCDIPLDDPSTSRRHAEIRPSPGGPCIRDLGSKNGTLVNGAPATAAPLVDGDEIAVGAVRIAFHASPAGLPSTSIVVSDAEPSRGAASFSRHGADLLLSQQRLKMLYDVAERLTRLRRSDELLDDAMDICFETLRFERGAIALRRPDGRTVEWPVVRNARGAEGEVTISRTILGRALDHGERSIVNDAGDMADPTVSIIQHGIRSAMCVPLTHGDDVIGVIYGDRTSTSTKYTTEDVDFLAGLARQISLGLINARLLEEQKAKVRLEGELALARTIQQGLFPRSLPRTASVSFAALNEPGRHVSGDYYDVISLDGGRFGVVIADVTGEGVAAALLMANVQAAVRVTLPTCGDLADLLRRWNTLIYENTDVSKFITLLAAVIDPPARRLTLACAGHHPPWVIRADGDAVALEHVEVDAGLPLGVVPDADFVSQSIELGPGSCTIFCYTDGVVEALDGQDRFFGSEGLRRILLSGPVAAPQTVVDRVSSALRLHLGSADPTDDVTMLAVALPAAPLA